MLITLLLWIVLAAMLLLSSVAVRRLGGGALANQGP